VSGAATTVATDVSEADEEDGDDEGDEDAQAGPAPKAKPARKPLPRPRPLVAALSALLVVLLVASGWLFVSNHKMRAAETSRAAALDTARGVATSLTTITPDNAPGQIDSLTKQATGSFKEQIAGYSAMFQAVLKQGNVASRGTITAAGIEKMEGDSASAIVAVSALITSGQVPQGQPRTYRLLVSLQRDGGQWLASNVDFVS
jgi:Mce-associated membrane protein